MEKVAFTQFPVIETERLILRRITTADADAWFAVHQHQDVMKYLMDFDDTHTDMDEINEMIAWCDGVFTRQTGIRWAITLKPDDTMIGSCGFHLYSKHHRQAEIGYELHHDYWRRGIMREAVTALLKFCFDDLNLHRVEANVTVGNEASAGLLRSMGFMLEGTWRDKVFARGKFHDLWQFGLLESEYQK